MNYLINFNTLSVESKTEKHTDGLKYVKDNDLDLGVAVISCEDELVLEFTLGELQLLANNVAELTESKKKNFEDEDNAAKYIWEAMESEQDRILNLKKGKLPSKNKTDKKSPSGAKGTRMKLDYNDEVIILDSKCKSGSILDTIVNAVDEEMCSTVGEVIEFITENHIIPKSGELADVKFAEHNIKYFVKQEKIKVEEGL